MENAQKLTLTEEEAINLTIEHGYNGAEFETKTWIERGCLRNNGTMDALISKLKSIYENVEIVGKGQKRRYILSGKKDKVSERDRNYKGKIPTNEDKIMMEYIFNTLVINTYNDSYSYKAWAKKLGFFNTDSLSIKELIETIKDNYGYLPNKYNSKEIVSKFLENLNTRNKSIIDNSFKHLEKEGRIKVFKEYNFMLLNDSLNKVDKLTYENVDKQLNAFLNSIGVTRYLYYIYINNIHKTKSLEEKMKKVYDYLSSNFGIKYLYKSLKVLVLTDAVKMRITNDEFKKAYFNRLIKLTIDKQSREDHNNSLYFWKRFNLLNTLVLLDFLKISGINELLKKEKENFYERLEKYFEDCKRDKEDKLRRRHTFGKN